MFKKIPKDKSYEYKGYKIERRYHGAFKRNFWLIDEVDLNGREWMKDYLRDDCCQTDLIFIDNGSYEGKKYYLLESFGSCKAFISQILLNEDWS